MTKLAEVLTGPETWAQGFAHREGTYCLVTALWMLHDDTGTPDAEFLRMQRVIHAQGAPKYTSSWVWNDEPGRTWEEVASVVEAYDRDRMLNP